MSGDARRSLRRQDDPRPSIKRGEGRVSYLVEVCDPPESEEFAYTVNDVLVSDFITPAFYDPVAVQGVRYSFTGAVKRPRQVLEGGYISWRNQTNEHIEQLVIRNGKKEFRDLGVWHPSSRSVREFVDSKTEHPELEKGLSPQNERLARPSKPNKTTNAPANRPPNSSAKILETLQHGA